MRKLAGMVMLGVVFGSAAGAAEPVCDGEVKNQGYLSERYVFKVAGKGRLYFHTMPDATCIDRKVFVIPGDALTAYSVESEKEAWASVAYTSKDGKEVSGWVRTDRLQFESAFGMHMAPAKVKYYEAAARAAKAGKLGMP